MPERWLTEMRKIGRMEPFEDLLERAERGPSLPEPGSRPATRMAVALFAVAIAVAGSWLAFRALTGTGDAQPMSGGTADFSAMWPETSLLEAQQVQALADVGDPEVQWRTDAATVAVRFAHVVLGWSDPMAGVTATDDPDTVSVSLHGPDASCQGAVGSATSANYRDGDAPAVGAPGRRWDLERYCRGRLARAKRARPILTWARQIDAIEGYQGRGPLKCRRTGPRRGSLAIP